MSTIKKYLDSIRHFSLPATRAMKNELDVLRQANTVVSTELENVRCDLQRTREDGERLHAELRQQIRQIRAERSQAQQQVEVLERSLAHAEHRQKFAESHMESMEKKLEEERTRHDDNMHVTRTRLMHMQEEQRALLTQQTELTSNLGNIGARLLDSTRTDKRTTEFSLMQLVLMSGVLFITGTLLGVLSMQSLHDNNPELDALKHDIRDMRGFMRQHMDNQDALIAELSLALNSQATAVQASTEPADKPEASQREKQAVQDAPAFKPDSQDIHQIQAGLMALGYSLGMSEPDGELEIKTRQALQEFSQFYAPQAMQGTVLDETLMRQILTSAERVSADAAQYHVDSDVLAAIRLGGLHTGVDFSFLMELARAESNFDATAHAASSTAVGLYQFSADDWIESIRLFGNDYGLDEYVSRLGQPDNAVPDEQAIARDPVQLEVLALRLNPRLSTLMVAENIKRHLHALPQHTNRDANRTDLYIAHLFGLTGAASLLKALEESPDTTAADILPDAAAHNPLVFQTRGQRPRTLAEVYRWLDRKFNTARYDERQPD